MATEQKKQGKGKKLRRCSKHKNKYQAQVSRTETNKRRRIGRRIRNHPNDQCAIKRYERDMGSADGHLANLTSKGRWLAKRA